MQNQQNLPNNAFSFLRWEKSSMVILGNGFPKPRQIDIVPHAHPFLIYS